MIEKIKELNKRIPDVFKEVLQAVLLAYIICTFLITNAVVPTSSMAPTIPAGARVIGNRLFQTVERGDIMVFESNYDNKKLLKRLIGLPNDIVEIVPDDTAESSNGEKTGYLVINGERVEEEYLSEPMLMEKYQRFEVPENCYFFLGDNRNHSYDARYWENPYIEEDKLISVVCFQFWPEIKKLN